MRELSEKVMVTSPNVIEGVIRDHRKFFDEFLHQGILYLPEKHANGYHEALGFTREKKLFIQHKVVSFDGQVLQTIFYDTHHHQVWGRRFLASEWGLEKNILTRKG